MEKKLFLLDAYANIYRAYYALIRSPRVLPNGFNTSAIFGFVNILEDVIKTCKPTHLAVAFDPAGKTFRHTLYEPYKAQRQATPEDIKLAIPVIKEILEAYNIPIIEVPDFEADDVIGTVSHLASQKGFDVYMVTPDKDYAQLVNEHVSMYRPSHSGGYQTLGVEEVKEKWSVQNTDQIIDLLGLMGDSSDNIPGCPGVGEKTAIKLLQDFGSIDNLLVNTEKLKGALKTKVENNIDNIKLSKYLATIRLDVPFEFKEDDFVVQSPNLEKLVPLFQKLQFKSFLSKYEVSSKTKNEPIQLSLFDSNPINGTSFTEYSNLSDLTQVEHHYQLIENQDDISKILPLFSTHDFFCFDTETTGISPLVDNLVGISISFNKNEAFFIYLPAEKEKAKEWLSILKPFFEDAKTTKIGQNIKFDILFLRSYDIQVRGPLFDTMVAHYLIQPELKHNMDYLAEVYLSYKTISYEELCGPKGKNQTPLRLVDHQKLCDYACEDVDITLQLKEKLEPLIKENQLDYLFYEVECPLIYVLASMEWEGVRIDIDALQSISKDLNLKLSEIEQKVYSSVGEEFNLSSPRQVGDIIYNKLGLVEKAKKTKTGQYSTSEEVLESLRGKHEVIDYILEYRGIKKILSTYSENLPTLINPRTGKIHTSFNQTIVSTGRLSSSNPNLQNIPVRDELGKEIRKAFISDPGCYFVASDYSQIELRLLAHLSQDENMVQAFNSDSDIHASTASKIFNVPLEEVTADMRRKAKTANFGIVYGISVFGLAERLSIPRAEAKTLIEDYYSTYPTIQSYMTHVIEKAREDGFVETLFHRKRFLPDINSRNATVRSYAERNAVNAPIQGTAADIIKIAMVNIYKRLSESQFKTRMIIQVHDELIFNVPSDELDSVTTLIKEEMESAYKLSVPLIADCGIGKNWLEAH